MFKGSPYEAPIRRRHATSVLSPALMLSLAVHAAAGGLLFQNRPTVAVEPPRPLTVTIAALPPAVESPVPPPVVNSPAPPVSKNRPLPVPQVEHAPAPTLIAVERTESAPAVTAPPAVEAPPAPVVIAKAAAPAAHARPEAVELPHFNVAYLNNPRPAYPPIARRLGLEGLVLLRVDVSPGGAPEKIVVAQSSGAALLDEAAVKAVQGWTFVPARRGDTPIAHPVEVPIRFQLKN
jgi:protein TonB